jgi:hypothetical protein
MSTRHCLHVCEELTEEDVKSIQILRQLQFRWRRKKSTVLAVYKGTSAEQWYWNCRAFREIV